MHHPLKLYAYVGGKGGENNIPAGSGGTAGFNGGARGGDDSGKPDCGAGGSGGASDVRIYENNLYSRIIVAGGGGSPGCYGLYSGDGGSGGGISGIDGSSNIDNKNIGGKGGSIGISSLFGNGEKGEDGTEAAGSGGGGYFAGYGGKASTTGAGGGGGGSSYVSGFIGCKTLLDDNTLGNHIHPSSLVFTDIVMIPGNETNIPTVDYSQVDYVPHSDNGLIVITKLWDIDVTCKHKLINTASPLIYLLTVLK